MSDLEEGIVPLLAMPINPDRLYDAVTTAAFLGLERDTLYTVPVEQLPKTRVGPRRGRVKYRGAHILEYMARGAA